MSIVSRLVARVKYLSKLYVPSKLRIGCQSIICLLALGNVISLSITFTSPTPIVISVFENILCTLLMVDLSLRGLAQDKFKKFMSAFTNVVDSLLAHLLMLVVGVRFLFKHTATFDWFINACNLLLLSCVFAKATLGLAFNACRMFDRKYMLLELSDYKTFGPGNSFNSANQPDPIFHKNLTMRRQEKQGVYDTFQGDNKYQ